jgi:hypothetical protein
VKSTEKEQEYQKPANELYSNWMVSFHKNIALSQVRFFIQGKYTKSVSFLIILYFAGNFTKYYDYPAGSR